MRKQTPATRIHTGDACFGRRVAGRASKSRCGHRMWMACLTPSLRNTATIVLLTTVSLFVSLAHEGRQVSAQDSEDLSLAELTVGEREAFDRITLNEANENAVLEVFPLGPALPGGGRHDSARGEPREPEPRAPVRERARCGRRAARACGHDGL